MRDGNLSEAVLTELFVSGSGRETSSTFNFSRRDDLSITAVDRGATSGFHIVPNDSYPSGKFRSAIPPPLSFTPVTLFHTSHEN